MRDDGVRRLGPTFLEVEEGIECPVEAGKKQRNRFSPRSSIKECSCSQLGFSPLTFMSDF